MKKPSRKEVEAAMDRMVEDKDFQTLVATVTSNICAILDVDVDDLGEPLEDSMGETGKRVAAAYVETAALLNRAIPESTSTWRPIK